ncbi:hase und igel isoform X2 [Anticarsia gemmatalis]|uniref:hase und igel isoform X2 n=1 Tax=Anticarsia gemmatalis TaxID=129554 RepID=UPI003F758587
MHKITLFILAAVFAVALAGQYYVPRAYYTIDAEGHESARVPLRRLRRSLQPYPYVGGNGNPNAGSNVGAWGPGVPGASAHATAQAAVGGPVWALPGGIYGSSNPALRAGETRRQSGPVEGRSLSASSSIGLDSSGRGYYDQSASVGN